LSAEFTCNAVDSDLLDVLHPGRGYRLRWNTMRNLPCSSFQGVSAIHL
jgi:hypothetical protein